MQYDSYYSKMQRFARFMRRLFRYIVPISIVLGIIIVATVVTMVSVGSFKEEISCPENLTYGETVDGAPEAFLSDVYYEYKAKGSNEWTTTMPSTPGEYVIRAVSSNAFGGKKYSAEKAFVLNKKDIEVKVVEESVRYGDPLTVSADLVNGDTIKCSGFNFKTISDNEFTVSPDTQKIVILNKDGKDVTSSYNITAVTSQIALEKRPLRITVSDQKKEYDGAILAFDGFEYNEDQLAEGDMLIASFDKNLANAGEIINEPTIQIKNEQGKDVTSYYQIESVWGKLTVDKRMITITVNGKTFMYDGKTHSFDKEGEAYSISADDKAFLEGLGHRLLVVGQTTVKDVNESEGVENALKFKVVDAAGNDVSANYNLFFAMDNAQITVVKRPVVIRMYGAEKIYDGKTLGRYFEIDVLGEDGSVIKTKKDFVDFDSINEFIMPEELLSQELAVTFNGKDAINVADSGSFDVDKTALKVNGGAVDVSNYSFTYEYYDAKGERASSAVLTVMQRPVVIRMYGAEKVYDGKALGRRFEIDVIGNDGAVLKTIEEYVDSDNVNGFVMPEELNGQKLEITFTGKDALNVADSGSFDVDKTAFKVNDGEADASNYSFTYEYYDAKGDRASAARLTVAKRLLAIDLSDGVKTYNGKPFDREYTVTEFVDNLEEKKHTAVTVFGGGSDNVSSPLELTGHTLTFVLDGNRTNVSLMSGEKDTYSVKDAVILDADGNDVTANYDITKDTATLTVNPLTIAIQTFDVEKVYDGKPIDRIYRVVENYNSSVTLGDDGKIHATGDNITFDLTSTGQTLHFTLSGNKTNVDDNMASGESGNYAPTGIRVTSGSGADEKEISLDNFIFETNSSSLSISKKPITVTAGSTERLYDGKAFVPTEFTNDLLAEGHTIEVKMAGSFTDYTGDAKDNNIITSVVIKDADGNDVTDNYTVTKLPGTVKINRRSLKIELFNKNKTYDGKAIDREYLITEINDQLESVPSAKLTAAGGAGDEIRFDLTETASHYVIFTLSGNRTNVVTDENNSDTYEVSAVNIFDATGKDVTENFNVSYNSASLSITPRKLTIYAPSASKVFDGTPLTRGFTATELQRLENALNSANASFYFDENTENPYKLTESDLAQGIKHSIELKVVGEELNMTEDIDETTGNVTTKKNNNNIDIESIVIKEGNIDVTSNYVIETVAGSLNITRNRIVIGVKNALKYYDGTPILCNEVYVERYVSSDGTEYNSIHPNHKVVDVVVGVRNTSTGETDALSKVGSAESYIIRYKIVDTSRTDENGEYVDVTGDYYIDEDSKKSGKLVIEKSEFTVQMKSDDKIYDGKALNRIFTVEYKVPKTDNEGNIIYVEISREEDGKQVTYRIPDYKLEMSSEITVGDDNRAKFEIYGGEYVINFTGENIVNAGESYWKVDSIEDLSSDCYVYKQRFVDKNGAIKGDATQAKLKIEKRTVTVYMYSASKIYDGSALNREYIIEVEGEMGQSIKGSVGAANIVEIIFQDVASQKMTLTFSGNSITDAEMVDWKLVSHTVNGGEELNENYKIVEKYFNDSGVEVSTGHATLNIEKRTIKVYMYSASKIYNGNEALNRKYKIEVYGDGDNVVHSYDGFVDENNKVKIGLSSINSHEIVFTFDGENITDAETVKWKLVSYTVTGAEELNGNYNVETKYLDENGTELKTGYATLKIDKRAIEITVLGDSKIYDGVALKVKSFKVKEADNGGALIEHVGTYTVNGDAYYVIDVDGTGEKLRITLAGEITDAGKIPATATAKVESGRSLEDVYKNYEITYIEGTLEITKRQVVIRLYGDEKIYDGNHLDRHFEIDVIGKNGDFIKQVSGSVDPDNDGNNVYELGLTEKVSNYTMTVTFFGKNPTDVADTWLINGQWGYDGYAVSDVKDGVISNENFDITVEYYASKNSENAIEDAEYATLTINKRKIVITVSDESKIYDGKVLKGKSFKVQEANDDGILEEHKNTYTVGSDDNLVISVAGTEEMLRVDLLGEGTDAGTYYSNAEVTVKDGRGLDNYAITYNEGELKIAQRQVVIKLYGAEKIYDGEYLGRYFEIDVLGDKNTVLKTEKGDVDRENSGNNIIKFVMPESISSQTLKVVFTGKNALDVADSGSFGVDEDAFAVNDGEVALSNYAFTYEYYDKVDGEKINKATSIGITIKQREIVITVSPESKIYDGKVLKGKSFKVKEADNDGALIDHIETYTVNGEAYYVIDVEGTGETLRVILSGDGTNAGTHYSNAEVTVEDGRSLDNYAITCNSGELKIAQRQVVIRMYGAEKIYDGKVLGRYFDIDVLGEDGAILSKTGVEVDSENSGNNIYELDLDEMIAGHVMTVTFFGTNAIDAVDGSLWGYEDYAINDGIDKNNFKVIAEYYDAEGEKINEAQATLTINKREIVITVSDESKIYDGKVLKGDSFTVQEANDDGILADHEKPYTVNGEAYYVIDVDGTGEKLRITLSGDGTNAGTYSSEPTATVEDGRSLDNYAITYNEGTLTINKRTVKLTRESQTKIYDGKELVGNVVFETENGDRGILSTHSFSVISNNSITDAGVLSSILTNDDIKIESDGVDVTGNYIIDEKSEFGSLTIKQRKISIKIDDVSKEYDGTALYATGFTVIVYGEDELGNDKELFNQHFDMNVDPESGVRSRTVTLEGTGEEMYLTFVGEKTNVEDIATSKIGTGNINGVAIAKNGNYDVELVEGTITIDRKKASITSQGMEFTYNGKEQYCEEFVSEGFLEGHTVKVDTKFKVKDVNGEGVENVLTYKIVDGEGKEIALSNYDITYSYGTLVVKPVKLVFSTVGHDASKIYDGGALSLNEYDVIVYDKDGNRLGEYSNSLTIGEDTFTVVTSSIINVNETAEGNNRIEEIYIKGKKDEISATVDESGNVTFNGKQNYEIEFKEFGTLTVTPVEISIQTPSATKKYDGKPLTEKLEVTVKTLYDEDAKNLEFKVDKDGILNVKTGARPKSIELIKGEILELVIGGEQTAVGTSKNTIARLSIDGVEIPLEYSADEEYTYNYKLVEKNEGDLVVEKGEVVITPDNITKVYDGENFSALLKNYTVTGLGEGHEISILEVMLGCKKTEDEGAGEDEDKFIGINVGEWTMSGDLKKYQIKSGIEDVSENYNVTISDASLTVEMRKIKITTYGASKTYDGKVLTKSGHTVEASNGDRGLIEGHVCTVYVSGSITEPGTADNVFAVSMVDENGNDVLSNYDIEYDYGTLEVKKITISAIETDTKIDFDNGTPLTCENVKIKKGNLLDGHKVKVTFTGKQEGVGSSENTVDESSLKIVDKDGKDVTRFYDISNVSWTWGTLTVNLRNNPEYNPGIDIPAVGETSQIGLPEGIMSGDDLGRGVLYDILIGDTDVTRLYLKQMSFGDYMGNSWAMADEYDATVTVNGKKYSMAYLVGLVLQYNGYGTHSVEISSGLMQNYIAPNYLSSTMGSTQLSDAIISGNAINSYTLMYYTNVDWSNLTIPAQYRSYELAYRSFVKNNYLAVSGMAGDITTSEYLIQYMKNNGIIAEDIDIATLSNPDKLELIEKISNYMQTTDKLKYNIGYDRALDASDNVAVEFLEGAEGVHHHYATAATLMFRALGIPARYTIGYIADATGDTYAITGKDAHAWVEVYIDGVGWRYVEVTGGSTQDTTYGGAGVTGTPDGTKEMMFIAPSDVARPYNGEALVANKYTAYFGNTEFGDPEKYIITVTYGGTQTECGVATSTIEDLMIVKKGDGAEVPDEVVYHYSREIGTDKYYFEFREGELIVQKELKIEVGEYVMTYNGGDQVYDSNKMSNLVCVHGHSNIKADESWYLGIDESGDFFLMDNLTHKGVIKVHVEFNFRLENVGSLTLSQLNAMEGVVTSFTVTHYDDWYEDDEGNAYGIGEEYDVTRYYTTIFCDEDGNTESEEYCPLVVKKLSYKIRILDVTNVYNETYGESPLTSDAFDVEMDGGKPDDIVLVITTTGKISKVGTVDNDLASYQFYKIIMGDNGEELEIELDSENFDFDWTAGKLTLLAPQ